MEKTDYGLASVNSLKRATDPFIKVKQDIINASNKIKRKYRYSCGLVSEEVKNEIGCGDLFFESPDGQNGQLFDELRAMGYKNGGYKAEYYWKVHKDGMMVAYTEGDISIYQLVK